MADRNRYRFDVELRKFVDFVDKSEKFDVDRRKFDVPLLTEATAATENSNV